MMMRTKGDFITGRWADLEKREQGESREAEGIDQEESAEEGGTRKGTTGADESSPPIRVII